MKRFVVLGLMALLAMPLSVLAAADQDAQWGMVVTGTLTVNGDGSVQTYALDHPDKLPAGVHHLLSGAIPNWQFAPLPEGQPGGRLKADMAVRVVANKTRNGQARVRVVGATFGCSVSRWTHLSDACQSGRTLGRATRMEPPRYPRAAMRAGGAGTVFLVLQVGRDGAVEKAAAQRVNLYRRTRHPQKARKALAQASVQAARAWQFDVPTSGPDADKSHWLVRKSISFRMHSGNAADLKNHPRLTARMARCLRKYGGHKCSGSIRADPPDKEHMARIRKRALARYGQWQVYIAGPIHPVSWADDRAVNRGSGDAVAANTVLVPDARLVLETPVGVRGHNRS